MNLQKWPGLPDEPVLIQLPTVSGNIREKLIIFMFIYTHEKIDVIIFMDGASVDGMRDWYAGHSWRSSDKWHRLGKL